MLSINVLENRRGDFRVGDWMLDSGAFTRIVGGKGHLAPWDYAARANRWARCGNLQAVVSQDWMCERFVLDKAGGTIGGHQALTTAALPGAVADG